MFFRSIRLRTVEIKLPVVHQRYCVSFSPVLYVFDAFPSPFVFLAVTYFVDYKFIGVGFFFTF